jgi:hypothetical protein
MLAFMGVFLFVPETKGRTLEELQFTFDLPTVAHIDYRINYVCPRFVKKYIRRREVDILPFYFWARTEGEKDWSLWEVLHIKWLRTVNGRKE